VAFGRARTPEEIEAEQQRKAAEQAEKDRQKAEEQAERERKAFEASPQGRARAAYRNGDELFQFSMDVMNQQAVIVAMVGSTATQRTSDPSDVLNAVCREGWELVNGSFVFVEQGQQSRDKFMSSGQNVAIKGETVGYYLFRRRH
jgi:hypothetical protein